VWIATSVPKSNSRSAALDSAEIITLPTDVNGRVHLAALLKQLTVRGVRTLMVEGGPETIASFLRQRAADLLVVTIAPTLIQGLTLPRNASAIRSASGPRLEQPTWIQAGPDMVLWSRLAWEAQ
jgi:diaminohydroxyphosphoribosylaminopyrimidine deaminase/5-amino-6-(5-phosphoribosylamino)uracil reductase